MASAAGVEAPGRGPILGGVALEEVLRQRRDVLGALVQRRQVDLDGVEPEEQVLAEPPGGDLGAQVGVGGREDPHVDRAGAGIADPLQLAALEHAEQPGLLAQGQVRDLVEEEGAAVGHLEAARPGRRARR